jgi:hypothetical protein
MKKNKRLLIDQRLAPFLELLIATPETSLPPTKTQPAVEE